MAIIEVRVFMTSSHGPSTMFTEFVYNWSIQNIFNIYNYYTMQANAQYIIHVSSYNNKRIY